MMGGITKGAAVLGLAVFMTLWVVVSSLYAQGDRTALQTPVGQTASLPGKNKKKQIVQNKVNGNGVFQLGEVEVVARENENRNTTVDRVYYDKMRRFDANNVAEAVNLLPGVTLSETGARNEEMLYVRGFDLKHVPIFLDGVPIYVPYDGYPDLSQFKTFDLSEITLSKGFTSVLYGPNTMGGAINMITMRPQKKFEAEGGAGYGEGNTYHLWSNFGSNQGWWYIQGGASYDSSDFYYLSDDFTPTMWRLSNKQKTKVVQGAGERVNSDYSEVTGNLKLGLTPNDTDEYAITFMDQHSEKGVPPYTGNDPNLKTMGQFWRWPYWDVEGVHFNSNTALCDKSYVKTTGFYDKFYNELDSYTDENYDKIAYPPKYSFKSFYSDYTFGGSVEAGTQALANNFIKVAFHFKDDVHRQWETIPYQPRQRFEERNYSVGLEDTIDFTKKIYSIVGASYDRVDTVQAQDLLQNNTLSSFPLGSAQAWNPQGGIFYKLTDTSTLHFTIERKSRLPSIKDKYSYRLGQALPSPDLQPEYATNYEVGWRDAFSKRLTVEADGFYNDVTDYILMVTTTTPNPAGGFYLQNQNVGKVKFYGFELAMSGEILPCLKGGLNYTYLQYENDSNNLLLADLPHHKLFAYLWYFTPIRGLSLLTSVQYNSDRYSDPSYAPAVAGAFTLLDMKAIYQVYKGITLEFGVKNLTDDNWSLMEGYPMAGRTFFGNMRYKF